VMMMVTLNYCVTVTEGRHIDDYKQLQFISMSDTAYKLAQYYCS